MLNRTRHRLALTEQAKVEAELNMLKAQVNPHFLFNSLHNIYSLTLADDERSSKMILLLSDILRYTLYEAKGKQVSVEEEKNCLEKYVQLQQMRMPELDLSFQFQELQEDLQIAPLLLLPLLENAFKHCRSNKKSYFIQARFSVQEKNLIAIIKNSVSATNQRERNDVGGIGLQNLRRRLALIYPKGHELLVLEHHDSYQVNLTIDLNTYADHLPHIR